MNYSPLLLSWTVISSPSKEKRTVIPSPSKDERITATPTKHEKPRTPTKAGRMDVTQRNSIVPYLTPNQEMARLSAASLNWAKLVKHTGNMFTVQSLQYF